MKFKVKIRERAEEDIREARDWYEQIAAGLGSRFGDELDAVIVSLGADALIYAPIYEDVRRAMTRRFPYAVYFVVEKDRVSVFRVLHQARDPREWRGGR
jgi:plasmid stabilization system protein ParE